MIVSRTQLYDAMKNNRLNQAIDTAEGLHPALLRLRRLKHGRSSSRGPDTDSDNGCRFIGSGVSRHEFPFG